MLHALCAHYDDRKASLVDAFQRARSKLEEENLAAALAADEGSREQDSQRLFVVLGNALSAERESYIAMLVQKLVQSEQVSARAMEERDSLAQNLRSKSETLASLQRESRDALKKAEKVTKRCREQLVIVR